MSNLDLFIHVVTAVVFILIISHLCGRLFQYLMQPKVVGEMISGVLLGPTCFGYFCPELSASIFSKEVMPFLFVISNLGLSFYMFLVGSEIDFNNFTKKVMKQSSLLSSVAVIFPFIFGGIAAAWYFELFAMPGISLTSFSIFLGTAFAITAFPMLARILHEKNILNSPIGILTLISASIQDVVSWILLSFVTAAAASKGMEAGYITLFGGIAFVAIVFLIAKPLLKIIGKRSQKNGLLSQQDFAIIVISLLAAALITDKLGLYSVFGGFILGLAVPRDPVFSKGLETKLKDITVAILLPLFFTFSGLNANMLVLGNITNFIPMVISVAFAFLSKYGSSTIAMKLTGYSWRESSAIGGLTNARGLMELIVANIGLSYAVISKDLYSILVLIAILTTLFAMPIYNLSMGKKK
ncbi:MAG: cation:proton antiporter [Bacteroidetes bacterium]|nr:cation:proton antiporter [Bacteroidota bacterium]